MSRPLPSWRFPEGVDRPLWDYAQSERIAREEDAYFVGHPLLTIDGPLVAERFATPGRLIDLGSGAGRLSAFFASRGFDVTAVDLSQSLLAVTKGKGQGGAKPIGASRSNLCRLPFADASFDYAIAMFSTFGMIRGEQARRLAFREAGRVLKPGGRLAFHAHNLWLNLRDPQGRRWLIADRLRRLARRPGRGDRTMPYRGIQNMTVHLFTFRELRGLVRATGLRIVEVVPLHEVTARPIAFPRCLRDLRCGGWIIFADKPSCPEA